MHKSPTCLPHGQAFHIESHSFWFSSGNLSQLPLDLVPCNRGCKASLADLKRYAATMQEHCYESSSTTLKCNNLDVFSNNIVIIADRFNEKNLSQWTIHETCNAWDTEQTFHIMQQHTKKIFIHLNAAWNTMINNKLPSFTCTICSIKYL